MEAAEDTIKGVADAILQQVQESEKVAKGNGMVSIATLVGIGTLFVWVWTFRSEVLTPDDLDLRLKPFATVQESIRDDMSEMKLELRSLRDRPVPESVRDDIKQLQQDVRALRTQVSGG